MPKLIKDGELLENPWRRAVDGETNDYRQGYWVLSLAEYLNEQSNGNPNLANLAVSLPGDTDPQQLVDLPTTLALICIEFAAFADGRGFSLAHTIREHLEFQGELRASGYFLPDQLFYLSRCGFNSFEVSDDVDLETVQESLTPFSVRYQAAIDEPQPLFRRRS